MALQTRLASGNRLLSSLGNTERDLIDPYLQPVTLDFRQRLETAGRKTEYVYFIDAGLASHVAVAKTTRRQAEIAVVGREGMTGSTVILEIDRSPFEVFMQVAGHGRKIAVPDFSRLVLKSNKLMTYLLRYVHVVAVQTAHTALANAQGSVQERLARWLLMTHDRVDGDDLQITHDFVSVMLGVRRAGVTTALHELERAALISTRRSCITVLDRPGLEECANGLYGAPEAELERLFSKKF